MAERADAITFLTLHRADDARVFSRQARTLVEAEYTVRLVTPRGRSGIVDGVEVVAVRAPRSRAENFLATPWRLLWEFLRRPTRLVYLHDAPLLTLVPVLRALGFDVIYDAHEDYGNMLRHRDWIPKPVRGVAGRLGGLYERVFSLPARAVVAATAPLLDHFPHRDKVALYNLPTRDLIEVGAVQVTPVTDREFDVVHLGSLSDARLDFFARMVETLAGMRSNVRALVIGLLPHQVPILRQRFPETTMTVVERAPHAEVPALLGRCKVGVDVHPWLLPHLAVAVPVKVFEYMACGCAVVTSRLPEFERLLDPEDRTLVRVVRGDDPREFAWTIEDLLRTPTGLEETARTLRSRLSGRYTWDRERGKLVDLFGRVSARPESRRGRWLRRALGGRR